MNDPAEPSPLRRSVYSLLICVAVAAVAGRILAVPGPTHGDNDRSRWVTIRALVDHGTYVIGRRDPDLATPENPYGDVGPGSEEGWRSIDKVMNPETREFFSSKPPLLPTL